MIAFVGDQLRRRLWRRWLTLTSSSCTAIESGAMQLTCSRFTANGSIFARVGTNSARSREGRIGFCAAVPRMALHASVSICKPYSRNAPGGMFRGWDGRTSGTKLAEARRISTSSSATSRRNGRSRRLEPGAVIRHWREMTGGQFEPCSAGHAMSLKPIRRS